MKPQRLVHRTVVTKLLSLVAFLSQIASTIMAIFGAMAFVFSQYEKRVTPKVESCIHNQCPSLQQADDGRAYKFIFVEEGKQVPVGEICKVFRVARDGSTPDMDDITIHHAGHHTDSDGVKGVELELQENPLQDDSPPDALEVEMLDKDEELSKDVGVPGVTA